jgi:4-amino-4-deoxy-L-arabinose transferase-like glycosyltransferase
VTRALRPRVVVASLALVCGLAVARVAATHAVFSATADETQHIATGVAWYGGELDLWSAPNQWYMLTNGPLARAAVGLGPRLAGVRETSLRDILYAGPGYEATLTSARRGVLPFLVLLIVLTWWAARRQFGDVAGLASALAVSTLPPVLAHAGVATTDVAAAATYVLAVILLLRWLEAPSPARAAVLGLGVGLALATKMSVMTLFPAALVVATHRRLTEGAARLEPPRAWTARGAELALGLGAAGLVVWAVYRFSFGRPAALADPATMRLLVDHCVSGDATRRLVTSALNVPVPAPQTIDGLLVLCALNRPGMSASYLLGRITEDGFPLFFPVALLVKTPLPFIALAVLGLRAAVRDRAPARWRRLAPALVALTILLSVLPSRINIGVRHVLPLYPLLAIYVGPALASLWNAARPRLGRGLALALGAWQLAIPFAAAPDYLPWFNLLAGRHPEDVLLDSDLDWGQDLLRLERVLAERGVSRMSIAYFGPSDLCRHHLPPGRWLRPYERVTGTVVISEMYLKGVASPYYVDGDYCDRKQLSPFSHPDYDQFAWLRAYTPVARVGASILIYEIPPEPLTARPGPPSPDRGTSSASPPPRARPPWETSSRGRSSARRNARAAARARAGPTRPRSARSAARADRDPGGCR